MFSVGHSVTDDVLQENLQQDSFHSPSNEQSYLENTPGLLIDKTTDPLDA